MRELRRALVAAGGTTDDDTMPVTGEEALTAFSRRCLLTSPIRGASGTRLPSPDARPAALRHALGTPLPA